MRHKPNLENVETWILDEDLQKINILPLLKFKEGKQLDISVKKKSSKLDILNRLKNTAQT